MPILYYETVKTIMSSGLAISRPGFPSVQSKSIDEYIAMVKRRRKPMIITAVITFAVAIVAAIFWPPTYRSSAMILIEEQEIPKDMVRSTITGFASQRIQVIKQRTMTMANIMKIVKKFELYSEDELDKKPRTEIVEEFQSAVNLELVSVETLDPRSGRAVEAMIAFSLSFEGENPKKVQKVAGELVNLYLNENLRDRTEKTASTEGFIRAEAEELNKELKEIEEEIVVFKDEHQDALPERFMYNVSTLARSESQRSLLQGQLRELNKRELELISELAQANAYAPTILPTGEVVLADVDRLRALQAEYRRKAATYNTNHPDIRKLRREIDTLAASVGHAGDRDDLQRLLKDRKSELRALQENYSATHPEVIAQKALIEQLEEQLTRAESGDSEAVPDNPAYIFLQNQLSSVRIEKVGVEADLDRLEGEIDELTAFVALSPGVEKEYRRLHRNLTRTQEEYHALSIKLREAKMAGSLEEDRKGQRFTLIQPAQLPELPISPNRYAVVFGGLVFSLIMGFGVVMLIETLDKSIQSEKALAAVAGSIPLVSIGYINSSEEKVKKDRLSSHLLLYSLGSAIVIIGLCMLLIHIFYRPLDVLWFQGLRLIGFS